MDNEMLLQVSNLKTCFYTDKGIIPAVDGISFNVNKKQTIGIVGESGCGKSVSALSILKLIPPPGRIVAGQIVFDGKDILSEGEKGICDIRGNSISMIFQEPMTSLNPVYTAGSQVLEAVKIHNRGISKRECRMRAVEMFNLVGIPDAEKVFNSYPHQLSGGLRQRVMIAMALVCRSKLLIADEPTTALDVTIEAQILTLIKKVQRELETSIIMITHNFGVVANICDYVYVMYAGKIMEQAEIAELFNNPQHPYTIGLLKSIPGQESSRASERLYSIRGTVPNMLKLPKGCRFSTRCDFARDICSEVEPELKQYGGSHYVRCIGFEDGSGTSGTAAFKD